jgi:integrase
LATMKNQYQAYSIYLKRLPTHDFDRANEIQEQALQTIPINSAKRFIVALNSCCKWATRSGVISENPFHGMSAEIRLPKSEKMEDDINPFFAAERDPISEINLWLFALRQIQRWQRASRSLWQNAERWSAKLQIPPS